MHEPLGNGERRGCENGQSRTAEAGGELLPPWRSTASAGFPALGGAAGSVAKFQGADPLGLTKALGEVAGLGKAKNAGYLR